MPFQFILQIKILLKLFETYSFRIEASIEKK
jgi:hypothetical protein